MFASELPQAISSRKPKYLNSTQSNKLVKMTK